MSDNPIIAEPGWVIHLEGHEFDLALWREIFSEPPGPVVKLLPDRKTVLRSKEFDDDLSAREVKALGAHIIARLNGAILLDRDAKPVTPGSVFCLTKDGKQIGYISGKSALTMRAFGHLTATQSGPDGLPPPAPPQPRKWNDLAENDDRISDLLVSFSRSDNWYDIYKTIEFAEDLVGGKHKLKKMVGESGISGCVFDRLNQTANFPRHANARRPDSPVSFDEALAILKSIVRLVLDEYEKRPK